MQIRQERMPLLVSNNKDALLRANALDFVILNNKLLLEHLDGVQFPRPLRLRQHDFTKVSFAQDGKEVEVVEADSLASTRLGVEGQLFLLTDGTSGLWSLCDGKLRFG